jgi:hypothetical protein
MVMQNICSDFELIDPFRVVNPLMRRYSYIKGTKKSRIDRIYLPMNEEGKIIKQNFHETLNEDHKLIILTVVEDVERGKGSWCFNTDLGRDCTYRQIIQETITDVMGIRDEVDVKELWDIFKQSIKREAIFYSKEKGKTRRILEKEMDRQIENLENKTGLNERDAGISNKITVTPF